MTFPAFLDELRARTLLSAVIAPSVKLIRAGPRVEGLLPVPQREDAELHGQRRQGLLPLLRLRRAWRRDPLPHRRARPAVHGRGQGARRPRPGMDVPAPDPQARERAERTSTLTDVMAAVPDLVRRAAAGHRRRRGPRISEAAAASTRRPSPASASASRPTAATRSSARSPSLGEDKLIETGMLIKPEERRGQLRPLPRPPDDPDPRCARPGHRVRRPHPRRRASPNISTRPTRRSSTRAARSTTSTAPAPPAAPPSA